MQGIITLGKIYSYRLIRALLSLELYDVTIIELVKSPGYQCLSSTHPLHLTPLLMNGMRNILTDATTYSHLS